MADRAISDLTPASQVTTSDLFVLEQNNTAKSLTGQILINDLAMALDGHGGISSIAKTGTSSLVDTYTITYADETTSTFTVSNGKGISSYTQYWAVSDDNENEPSVWYETLQTMTVEFRYLWSYIHIEFNDGSALDTTAQVIGVYGDTGHGWYVYFKYASAYPTQDSDMGDSPDNFVGIYSGTATSAPTHYTDYTWYGWKGIQGNTGTSITGVAKTSTSGLVDTYTVSFSNGNTSTFTVTNGSNISTIAKTSTSGLIDNYTVTLTNGNTTQFSVTNAKSIVAITQTGGTHAAGTTDTYTIQFNDGDSATFQVYNGANGAGSVSSVAGIQAVDGNVPLILTGNGAPTTATVGQENQLYFDYNGSVLYICLGENGGTYSWQGAGVTVDSALSTSSTNPVQNKIITAKVGTTALNTTATDLSNAVNELANDIGNMSLTTSASDLTGAVNELDADVSGKVSKTGDTMTGNLTISKNDNPVISLKNTDMDNSAATMANSEVSSVNFIDGNDGIMAYINVHEEPSGRDSFNFAVRKSVGGVDADNVLTLYVDKDGNKGVAVSNAGAWRSALNAVNKSGDTMTGALTVRATNIPAGTPETDTYTRVFIGEDSTGNDMGYFQLNSTASGSKGLTFEAEREINGSSVYNGVHLNINSDGSPGVYLSQRDAWLEALGLASRSSTSTVSDIATAESGFSITSADYTQWGRVANIRITAERTGATVSSTQNVTVCTIKSGKRPAIDTTIPSSNADIVYGNAAATGVCALRVTGWTKNASKTFRVMYLI